MAAQSMEDAAEKWRVVVGSQGSVVGCRWSAFGIHRISCMNPDLQGCGVYRLNARRIWARTPQIVDETYYTDDTDLL